MIQLKSFQIRNFKGFKESPRLLNHQLNFFTGVNSGGKTTVIQALLLLREMMKLDSISFNASESLQLGEFDDVVFNHLSAEEIEFALQLELKYDENSHLIQKIYQDLGIDISNCQMIDLNLQIRIRKHKESIVVSKYRISYQVSERELFWFELCFNITMEDYEAKTNIPLWVFDEGVSLKHLIDKLGFEEIAMMKSMLQMEVMLILGDPTRKVVFGNSLFPKSCFTIDNSGKPVYKGFSVLIYEYVVLSLRQIFENLSYLGPIREEPRPYYPVGKNHEMDYRGSNATFIYHSICVGKNVAESNFILPPDDESGVAKFAGEASVPGQFNEFVSKWATYILGKQNKFATDVNMTNIELNVGVSNYSHKITNVGFGASQIFPVLVECIRQKNRIIILEQPDIQIHPNAQARMADFLIAASISNNLKFIIETHSEHLINRLIRRTVEDERLRDYISVAFIQNRDGLHSEMIEIQYDSYGRINDWPEDFFDTAQKENELIYYAQMEKSGAEGK